MELFKLEKPDLSAIDIAKLFKSYSLNHADEYTDSVYKASEPLYYYWDSIKHRQPPKGLTSLEYWGLIKHIRRLSSRKTYIKAESGQYFTWLRLFSTDEYLHKI